MAGTIALVLACFGFIVVIGGAVYEHAAVVPVWTSAVPASLTMFQGEYALAPGNFWIPVHPVALSLMVLALVLNWKTPRRNLILLPLAGYAAVLAVTFVYFVPELMALTQSQYASFANAELTRRGEMWELLSLVRLAFLSVLAMVMLYGLSLRPERVK